MQCWLAMTQLEIWTPPLLMWEVKLIKSKYLDAEIGMGYEICTGLSLVLICSCFNRKLFRSSKTVGSPLKGKYPSDFLLSQCSVCHFSRNVHHLDHHVEATEGKVHCQRNCLERGYPQSKVNRCEDCCNAGKCMELVDAPQCAGGSLSCTSGSRGLVCLTGGDTLKRKSKSWLLAMLKSC